MEAESTGKAISLLEEEIAACHAAVMRVFAFASRDGVYDELKYLDGATRLMRVQTTATALLERITRGKPVPPNRENSKTNVPASECNQHFKVLKKEGNVEELVEIVPDIPEGRGMGCRDPGPEVVSAAASRAIATP